MADALRLEIERIVREASAKGVAPAWVRLDREAEARRFPSTRAFRAWCLAHGVEVKESSPRDSWVRPADVDRAVEGFPAAKRAGAPAANDIDREIDRGRGQ